MTKSYVSMEQKQCLVCGKLFDTGAILLDRRLQNSMEAKLLTGTGICPEHQAQIDEGYILCIEADERTQMRTGRLIALRAERWSDIFDAPVPPKGVCFISPEVAALFSPTDQGADHESQDPDPDPSQNSCGSAADQESSSR